MNGLVSIVLQKRADINAELRGPLLVLLIVIPVLAIAGLRVHGAVLEAGQYQHQIRIAQIARARVLRFQLDEETGMRGFSATGDPLYLEPYKKARRAMPAAFASLEASLAPLSQPGLESFAQDEARQNQLWDTTIASELIADPVRSTRTLELQRRGKQTVDDFRNDDQGLLALLEDFASAADARSERAISDSLLYTIGALVVVTLGAAGFGFWQARTARLAFENRVLYENQKRIADSLQTAFLNKQLPATPDVGLHATYIPATAEAQVGGDWYDAFELPDKRILFSIGDVAGHGLEAAVVMSRARQAIVTSALHENDPAKVLERANEAILLQDSGMVTAICGYIDPGTLEVVYATAGHPAPILARPGYASEFLPHDGLPLGILPDTTYRTFVAHAFDGAVMVLYTDGVIEHKRDVIEGQARLLEATRLAALEEDPALAIQRLVFDASTPKDDVAILTVTFKRRPNSTDAVTSIGSLQTNRLDIPTIGFEEKASRSSPFEPGGGAADVVERALRLLVSSHR